MDPIVLAGPDALSWAGREDAQAQWQALLARCPWATGCQHPDFVLPWYRLYQPSFLPVLVVARDGGGALVGLLALALRHGGATLTGAGEGQAEYHAWLAPDDSSGFIAAAVKALRARFPAADIRLRYLPPAAPLQWTADAQFAGLCAVRSHRRPLMRIDPEAMARQRNKKNHRQNFNRLRRTGEVRFERVVEHERFGEVLGTIIRQYDFRQAALYRQMPFADDPFKKEFCLELHRRGLLHATVLWVGDTVAASHLGVATGRRAVHLGINTYNPALAAHSPGNLLLAMLGVHLAEENIEMLDLTPGGDPYKEHFATGHDTVYELAVYRGAARRVLSEARQGLVTLARERLRRAGYRPAEVLAAIDALRKLPARAWARLRARRAAPAGVYRYHGRMPPHGAGALPVRRNSLDDVLCFDAAGSWADYCAFLGLAMKRMERSQQLFTLVRNGTLQLCCWAAPEAQCWVLSDLYVHPRLDGPALVRSFIEQLLCSLHGTDPDREVVYRGALTALLEQCGFADEARQPLRLVEDVRRT